MKFQYLSDIHLEKGTKLSLHDHVSADNLVLSGDIGDPFKIQYEEFINHVSNLYKHIFIISGNHEYYSKEKTMTQTEDKIRFTCQQYPNVHYLQNETFEIPDSNIIVYGSTLWTDIDHNNSYMIQCMISDYRCIPKFTIPTSNYLHKTAKNILVKALEKYQDKEFIVICHHLPKKSLIDERFRMLGELNDAFASDVEEMDHERIKAVVYGHTHKPNHVGKYYCNPYGYPDENKNINLKAVFDLF
jgi:predicted phosphohydrolase